MELKAVGEAKHKQFKYYELEKKQIRAKSMISGDDTDQNLAKSLGKLGRVHTVVNMATEQHLNVELRQAFG